MGFIFTTDLSYIGSGVNEVASNVETDEAIDYICYLAAFDHRMAERARAGRRSDMGPRKERRGATEEIIITSPPA